MAVSYKRLWKLLVDKEMSKSDLRKKAEIAPNTMTKFYRTNSVITSNVLFYMKSRNLNICFRKFIVFLNR